MSHQLTTNNDQTYRNETSLYSVQCISVKDDPFNKIMPIYIQALSKPRVIAPSIIAARHDSLAWWKFPSWCHRWAKHDHDHVLNMRPRMLACDSFLAKSGKLKYIQKRNKLYATFELMTNIIFYNIMTLSIKGLFVKFSITDTQHKWHSA